MCSTYLPRKLSKSIPYRGKGLQQHLICNQEKRNCQLKGGAGLSVTTQLSHTLRILDQLLFTVLKLLLQQILHYAYVARVVSIFHQ